MKFRVERDTLRSATTKASAAIGRPGNLAALHGLHVHAGGDLVTIRGTDLDLTITDRIDADIDRPGAAVIPARPFASFLAKNPGAVTVDCDDTTATLTVDDTTARLRLIPVHDYPQMPADTGQPIAAEGLGAAAVRVAPFARSDQALGGSILGIRLDPGKVVATDSYRMAVADVPDLDAAATVPAAAVLAAARHADDLTIASDDRHVTLTADRCSWRTGLIEEDYPQWQRLLRADSPHHLTVNREALLEALDRVAFLAPSQDTTGGRNVVRFHIDETRLQIEAITKDVGDVTTVIDCTSDAPAGFRVAFNAGFLGQALAAHTIDDVTLDLVDALKPTVITEPGFLTLLMPVRVP